MRLTDIAPIAIILVVCGIALGAGAMILQQMSSQVTGVAASAIGNATSGIGTLASWLPTIALVVAAAIIIGIVFSSFVMGKRGE